MTQGRRESRSQVRLQVQVCGKDSHGNPFSQTAYARDTSYYGARVDGIECLKGPGDIVELKYRRISSKFRVVWVGLPGSKEHGHIGLRSLEPRKNIWNINPVPGPNSMPLLDRVRAAAQAAPEAPKSEGAGALPSRSERRRYKRHRCLGTVEFRITGNATTMSGKLTEVSLGGCYVQALGTCLPGTLLELALDASNVRVYLSGRVATTKSSKGMGIEFVSGSPGLKELPKLIEAVRRNAIAASATALPPTRARRPKPLA